MIPAIIDLDLCCPTSAFLLCHPHMYMTESGENMTGTQRDKDRETGDRTARFIILLQVPYSFATESGEKYEVYIHT